MMVNDNQFPAVTTGINRHNVSGKGEGSKGRGRSPRPSGKKIFGEGLRGGVLRTPPPPDPMGSDDRGSEDVRIDRAARQARRSLAALARRLSPANSRMMLRWTRRSTAAMAVIGFLKILSHSENTRLEVIRTDLCRS